ncbi:Mov34/MPN/PAD-1 family protein [Paenibacillus endoradicis]|uniref:Mov34/MPN/PAD-1 family protein n=1 Tax=Paenibacillus endoradicis TaxID=2972487 RepID=UPI0021591980|nr:Mov34/MPN/PAD-1 family protein [Paenibacillus endoradicis]
MNTLTMTSSCYKEIIAYGYTQLPYESCGVLASSDGKYIDSFIPIINDHPNPLHYFSFQPQSWIHTLYKLQHADLQLIGYMHTHPNEDAIPSSSDIIGFDEQSKPLLCIVSYKQKDSPYIRLYQQMPTKGMKDYPLVLT